MSVYHVFIINRAGSLIYDWESGSKSVDLEKTLSYPVYFHLEMIDQRPTVVFGERDGIRVGHVLISINGSTIQGSRISDPSGADIDVFTFLKDETNFPLNAKFGRPALSTNEKIILSSMFHSLYAIGAQLSPVPKSSGIRIFETDQFRLHCFQTITGVKFMLVADFQNNGNADQILRKIYELYADFALKNPFYSLDMPIRCELFDSAVKTLIGKFERSGIVAV